MTPQLFHDLQREGRSRSGGGTVSTTQQINWKCSKGDQARISAIARRAITLAKLHAIDWTFLDFEMDIKACHLNGCPLDLDSLYVAKDGDFGHDVFGIRAHLDRNTGQLTGCFVPRYAQKEAL